VFRDGPRLIVRRRNGQEVNRGPKHSERPLADRALDAPSPWPPGNERREPGSGIAPVTLVRMATQTAIERPRASQLGDGLKGTAVNTSNPTTQGREKHERIAADTSIGAPPIHPESREQGGAATTSPGRPPTRQLKAPLSNAAVESGVQAAPKRRGPRRRAAGTKRCQTRRCRDGCDRPPPPRPTPQDQPPSNSAAGGRPSLGEATPPPDAP